MIILEVGMKNALGGIRVIELSGWAAGPHAGMILGDMGADVILIEGPRSRLAGHGALTYKGQDNLFLASNRNKKSLGLDLKNARGKEIFFELVKKSDVFLTNLSAAAVERLEIDFPRVREVNPELVYTHITGYGLTGPYQYRPAFDAILQALSGGMSITGEPGKPPVRSGIAIADYAGGLAAAFGTVCALMTRNQNSTGSLVDISLLDEQISMLGYIVSQYLNFGVIQGSIGSGHQTMPLYISFQCKDHRYIQLAAQHKFKELCRILAIPDLIDDERFDTSQKLIHNRDALHNIIKPIFLTKTSDEWLDCMINENIPASKVNTIDEACSDPQVLARNMVATIEYPDGGAIKIPGNPVKIRQNTRDEIENHFSPPPDLGEHTDDILCDILNYKKEEVNRLKNQRIIF